MSLKLLFQTITIILLSLFVEACNYNSANLQSSAFWNQINCNYKFRQTQINCKWNHIICNQTAII